MGDPGRRSTLIGVDIGRVNTRVSIFGISEGKYLLQGCEMAGTEFGREGHLASGVHEALEMLQDNLKQDFIRPLESGTGRLAVDQQAVSQVGLILSAFPPVKAALFGVTARGSLAAGRTLAGKLPVQLAGTYGLADLMDEPEVIDSLLETRPEILILTGGTDSGVEKPLTRWVEIVKLICRILPENLRPAVFFAGNPNLDPLVRRRLEPNCRVFTMPNLQPDIGVRDDVPSQRAISQQIISKSMEALPGLLGLTQLAGDLVGTRGFMLDRMVRFISRSKIQRFKSDTHEEVLAIDVGAGSTMISAGNDGQSLACRMDAWKDGSAAWLDAASRAVCQWTAAPVSQADVEAYLANQRLFPAVIPQTLIELAMSQSLARYRIRSGLAALVKQADDFPYDAGEGLKGPYEPVIASGSVLTQAPTAGQAMLMLLDGLQPWRQTAMILDRYHILPVMGLLGELEPLLPVHVLKSDAFENLGTVIPVVSHAAQGVIILSVTVTMASGKSYVVDIPQGALRRVIVPPGEFVSLSLDPISDADVGAGSGVKHQIRVMAGTLGVVIDARGRPLTLPEGDEERIEQLRHWLWSLGG